MRLVLFSIYDSAAGSFMRPFPVASDQQAHRAFKDLVTDADHPIGKHPEDYTLHRLGVFDDQTGEFHNEINEQQQTIWNKDGESIERKMEICHHPTTPP